MNRQFLFTPNNKQTQQILPVDEFEPSNVSELREKDWNDESVQISCGSTFSRSSRRLIRLYFRYLLSHNVCVVQNKRNFQHFGIIRSFYIKDSLYFSIWYFVFDLPIKSVSSFYFVQWHNRASVNPSSTPQTSSRPVLLWPAHFFDVGLSRPHIRDVHHWDCSHNNPTRAKREDIKLHSLISRDSSSLTFFGLAVMELERTTTAITNTEPAAFERLVV